MLAGLIFGNDECLPSNVYLAIPVEAQSGGLINQPNGVAVSPVMKDFLLWLNKIIGRRCRAW